MKSQGYIYRVLVFDPDNLYLGLINSAYFTTKEAALKAISKEKEDLNFKIERVCLKDF